MSPTGPLAWGQGGDTVALSQKVLAVKGRSGLATRANRRSNLVRSSLLMSWTESCDGCRGHTQISITRAVYTHVPSQQTREALDKLGALLEGSGPGQVRETLRGADPGSVVAEGGQQME